MADLHKKSAKILVFSTEKISDPAIDMAGFVEIALPTNGIHHYHSLFEWGKAKLDIACLQTRF
jgi:hypothetical protein